MPNKRGKDIFAKTIYAEARNQSKEGQKWVGWVIKNRAAKNREDWGGSKIEDVCTKPHQFECWNNKSDIPIHEREAYDSIRSWSDDLYDAPSSKDPTGGCDHYNNPDTEGYPGWTNNVEWVRKIDDHQFYRGN